MKKSKLAIGLMSALLSVGGLAACSDVSYSEEGVILTYTGADGSVIKYTADDLLSDEFKNSENYQTVFDAVYKIIIKNYFTEVDADQPQFGKNQLASLKTKAQVAVDGDKQTASKKAESNGTSYDTEFSAILKEKNCENESELFDYYLYQYEEETFNDNFEKVATNMSILKNGTRGAAGYEANPWNGYFADKVPYHVSHILVKIEDADSTNYANATISEANAKKLFTVADALRDNTYGSFKGAARLSDDSAPQGDLGLVDLDKTAQYIDEFKYAMYAFENLYGHTTDAQASKISMDFGSTIVDYKNNSYLKAHEYKVRVDGVEYTGDPDQQDDGDTLSGVGGFATIPFGAFQVLESNAKRETGASGQKVNDGDVNFYPRNVFFNHYFNRHSFALVTPETADPTLVDDYKVYPTGGTPYAATLNGGITGTGFHTFGPEDGVNFTGTYLAAGFKLGDTTVYRPILVVRGGSAGEGGYQGIHFIVINRSPFEFVNGSASDVSVASLENYYTTYFPAQDNYPTYVDGSGATNKYQTYVNFSGNNNDNATLKSRAEEVLNAVKGYDTDGLKHFMFRKYFTNGRLAFQDAALADGLSKWMSRSEQNKAYNEKVEWENKWTSYVNTLNQATSIQQKKVVPLACAIGFSNHTAAGDPNNASHADAWNKVGGLCNDGKAHF